jgi:nucleotide-binding universal stress UspA family protein
MHAVEAAAWLAGELDASVVLVHVFDEWAIGAPATRELRARSVTMDDLVLDARRDANTLLHDMAGGLGDVEHTIELVEDHPVEGVLRAVRDHDPSVLVTGTAARGGFDRVLFGSVASELAAKSPCPVAAVPAGVKLRGPGPVLAVYDGSDHNVATAHHGAALATGMGRKLLVVCVGSDGAEFDAELSGVDFDVETAPADVDAVTAVTRAADRADAALIVAGTRGRGPLVAALFGSVSAGLVQAAERPVVVTAAG